MNKTIIIFALISLVMGITLTACKRHKQCGPEKIVNIISEKLDLDSEQNDKLSLLKDEILEVKQEVIKDREKHLEVLKEMILSATLDSSDIVAQVKEKHDQMEQYLPRIADRVVDFHMSLTQEQKEKVVEIVEKYHAKHSKHGFCKKFFDH